MTGKEVCSQEQMQIDSVKNLIPKLTSDTARIRNYLVLVEWIAEIEEWASWNKKASDLIEVNLKSDLTRNEKAIIKKFQADALNNLGLYYKEKNKFEEAMSTYYRSMVIQKELNNLQGEAICLTNIGSLEIVIGKPADAVVKFNEALKIFRDRLHDKKNTASVLNNIGSQYLAQGNTAQAIKYFNESLQLHKECKNLSGQVQVFSNFGILYYNLGDKKVAAEFYEKALVVFKKLNDRPNIAQAYNNLGTVIKNINPKKSLHYDSLALDMFIILKDTDGIASAYVNLGICLGGMNDIKSGKNLIRRGYELSKKAGFVKKIANNLINLAQIYNLNKQSDSAIYWLKSGEELAYKIGNMGLKKDVAETYSNIYKAKGNYTAAYEYYRKFKFLNDSIINKQTKNAANSQLSRLEFEKREVELKAEQDKKDLIAEDEKRKQKIVITAVSLGLFLVLILAGVIFRSLRQNQKKNKIITEQKKLVDEKQKEILDSIHYAKRIQQSLLPTEKYIDKNLDRLNNS